MEDNTHGGNICGEGVTLLVMGGGGGGETSTGRFRPNVSSSLNHQSSNTTSCRNKGCEAMAKVNNYLVSIFLCHPLPQNFGACDKLRNKKEGKKLNLRKRPRNR